MAQSFLHTEVDPHQIKNIPVPGSMRDFDDPPRDFKKTNFSTFLKCFETIIVKSLPSIIVMELSISFTLVNIYLVEGNREIIGVGFGSLWLNLVVKGILLNTNLSIGSVMNKHFREQNYFKMGICYQRSLVINGIYLIAITPFLGFSKWFLTGIGISSSIVIPATTYAWEVVPSLYASFYFDATKNYLQAMDIYYPIIIIQFFSAIIHIGLANYFIFSLEWSIKGAAWAKNFSDSIRALLIYFYIIRYLYNHPSWCEWNRKSLKALKSYTKTYLKMAIKYFALGSSFELMTFVAIHLSYNQIAAQTSLAFTAQAIYMIYMGMSQVVQANIYQQFKKVDIKSAKSRAVYFLISNIIVAIIITLILHIFKHEWTDTFNLNEASTQLLLNMLNLFSLTLSIEGAHMIIASILNAIGEHNFALNLSLIALYGVGILGGMYQAYFKEKGIYGLWLGWATGLSVSTICLLIKLALVDWLKAAKNLIKVAHPKEQTKQKDQEEVELQEIQENKQIQQ